ncbi:uncharacterized protein V1510DRAFT_423838 [Dipodascopsis tothii]|uniref:uncharacterized protein n=1 Tax=Dipodascopsis tothii TaxID=44089 RepID=UPI0034CE6968
MDMSSLNSHLPSRASLQDGEEESLLSTFRLAANAMTKLYKSATQETERARSEGYMSAVNDMLGVLVSGGDIMEWVTAQKLLYEGIIPSEQGLEEHVRRSPGPRPGRARARQGRRLHLPLGPAARPDVPAGAVVRVAARAGRVRHGRGRRGRRRQAPHRPRRRRRQGHQAPPVLAASRPRPVTRMCIFCDFVHGPRLRRPPACASARCI